VSLRDFIESDRRPIDQQLRDLPVFSAMTVKVDTVVRATGSTSRPSSSGRASTGTLPP